MERKVVRNIRKNLSSNLFYFAVGIFLVFLIDKLYPISDKFNTTFAFLIYTTESVFFKDIEIIENKIYIDNIEFIVTTECTNLKIFALIFPYLVFNKKFRMLFLLFILTSVLSLARMIFEIFLILESNLNVDYQLSYLQNIILPSLMMFIVLFSDYYGSFKLRYNRVF